MSKCHVGDVASGRVFSPPDQTPPKDVNKRIFASQSKSHARSDSMSILPEGRGREGDAILFNTMVSRSGFGEKAKKPCACALPSVDWLVHRREDELAWRLAAPSSASSTSLVMSQGQRGRRRSDPFKGTPPPPPPPLIARGREGGREQPQI